ncbi:tetratricopeptide repeat protein [bacterium]|nr:tetratricopeptide repeat protein [bacterium]
MKECPVCFTDLPAGATDRCPTCGASFAATRPAPARPEERPQPPSEMAGENLFDAFRRQFEERSIELPEEAQRRAKALLASAESELRQASVLMADLCGFSGVSSGRPAEDVSRLAQTFCRICSDAILRRGGFVVKFEGDAVLAVFGAPVAYDRDVESAVEAALDIRERIQLEEGALSQLGASVGIATGEVQSGVFESPGGRQFDIYGNTVNLAARLQQAAGRGEIVICRETWQGASRAFEAAETDPLELKNMDLAYRAWRVSRRRERSLPRRIFDTAFCGRERERKALEGYLSDAGGSQLALATGEAGLGKTRLVREALRSAGREEETTWWEGSPSCRSLLLWPVLEWLREEMRLQLDAPPEAVGRAASAYLAGRFAGEESDPLLLQYVFGMPEAIQAMRGIPSERLQRNVLGFLASLILPAGGKPEGRVLVVDDFQWVDSLTWKLVEHLLTWSGGQGLKVLLIGRPDSEGKPLPRTPHPNIHLQPLTEPERRTLLSKLVPAEEFLPEIRQLVISRAAGNPLFIEEMTRIVRETMRNNSRVTNDQLRNNIVEVIPVSLRDLIQSRIDLLDGRTRQVLQCGAVLGLAFTLSLIELFDIVRDGLTEHLEVLRGLHYLEKDLNARDLHYFFTHGLYRDVAYSTMLWEQRQRLHAELAKRLEDAFRHRLPEYYDLLAFHYSKGGENRKAIYYLVKTADRHAALGASESAIQNYREAMELLGQETASDSDKVLMARMLTRCARLLRATGDHEEAEEMLAGAVQCAEGAENRRLVLDARLEQAIGILWRGGLDEARDRLGKIIAEAEPLDASLVLDVAYNALAVVHLQRGDHEAALEAFQRLAKEAERHEAWQVKADAFNNAGLIYWKWGQYPQALKAFRRALALRHRVSDYFGLCATLSNLGIIQEQLGEVHAARKSYLNALRLAEKTGYAQGLSALESNLSNLTRRTGILADALKHATRALEFAQQAQDPNLEAIAEENLGLVHANQGETDLAREHLTRCLDLAKEHGNAELQLSAETGLLELSISEGGTAPEAIVPINALLEIANQKRYTDYLPRLYRLKSRILEASKQENRLTSQQYLDLALEKARQMQNLFEEIESWKSLESFHIQHGRLKEAHRCEEHLVRLTNQHSS